MSEYLVSETKEKLIKEIDILKKDISTLKLMYASIYGTCQGIIKENKDLAQLFLEIVSELRSYGR